MPTMTRCVAAACWAFLSGAHIGAGKCADAAELRRTATSAAGEARAERGVLRGSRGGREGSGAEVTHNDPCTVHFHRYYGSLPALPSEVLALISTNLSVRAIGLLAR